jgi:hypothetical protein
MNCIKALIIQMPSEVDLHNVIQVARAEGMKLYRDPGKIKVLDVINKPCVGRYDVFSEPSLTAGLASEPGISRHSLEYVL